MKHTITFQRSVTERVTIETEIAPGTREGAVLLAAKTGLKDEPRTTTDSGWLIAACEPPLSVHAVRGGNLLCGQPVEGNSFVGADQDGITCPRCAEMAAKLKAKRSKEPRHG